MSDIIDLTAERNRRADPDPEFIRKDEYGRPLYCFGVDYTHSESTFSFQLWAYDWADAEAKVSSIRESAKVFGQLYSKMPA